MDPLGGAVGVIGLLVAATLLGLWLRKRSSKVTHGGGSAGLDPADFNLEQFGPGGVVVQFSTDVCARCPNVKRQLSEITGEHASLRFQHLDVTSRPDLASKYRLLQTPTVLTIDANGVLQSRLSGALTREQLTAAVTELTGGTR